MPPKGLPVVQPLWQIAEGYGEGLLEESKKVVAHRLRHIPRTVFSWTGRGTRGLRRFRESHTSIPETSNRGSSGWNTSLFDALSNSRLRASSFSLSCICDPLLLGLPGERLFRRLSAAPRVVGLSLLPRGDRTYITSVSDLFGALGLEVATAGLSPDDIASPRSSLAAPGSVSLPLAGGVGEPPSRRRAVARRREKAVAGS